MQTLLWQHSQRINWPSRVALGAFVGRLALAAINLYLGGMGGYLLARLISRDGWGLVSLLNNFAHWMLLPAVLILPVLLICRCRWQAMGAGLLAVLFAAWYGGLFWPQATPDHQGPVLRVLTYNVALAEGDALVDLVRESEADIVGMVELSNHLEDLVAEELATAYPYQVLNGGGIPGKGLLSRYPILESDLLTVQANSPYIFATLDVNGTPVDVYVAHPPRPFLERSLNFYGDHPQARADIDALLARAGGTDRPTLMLGDFNLVSQHPTYDRIRSAGFTDVFAAVGHGWGLTFPTYPLPMVRIDYVWVNAGLVSLSSSVTTDAGSDHLPLLAEVGLSGE